jgi:hypothetical protein
MVFWRVDCPGAGTVDAAGPDAVFAGSALALPAEPKAEGEATVGAGTGLVEVAAGAGLTEVAAAGDPLDPAVAQPTMPARARAAATAATAGTYAPLVRYTQI